MSLTSFFLCAGYGSRLRPLTNRVPKPAIQFLGQSALEINVRAVDEALSPDRRIANTHHLPDAIRAIASPLKMDVIFESEILGTGGCISNAADLLRDTEHFLVHNADLIHAIDLAALYRAHLASGALATLAGLNVEGGANTLSVSREGALLGVHGFNDFDGDPEEVPRKSGRLTFAGVAFYRRDVLAFIPNGVSDIKPWWIATMKGGGKIRVVEVTGTPWYDFGTPQGLWEALKYRMQSTGIYTHNYSAPTGTNPFVSNESGVDLPEGLKNVAVYEAPRIPLDEGTTNLLTGYDFDWKVRP